MFLVSFSASFLFPVSCLTRRYRLSRRPADTSSMKALATVLLLMRLSSFFWARSPMSLARNSAMFRARSAQASQGRRVFKTLQTKLSKAGCGSDGR
uniref:Putative secreted protein n=1 Tax=Ixodes ricinus TaxID=34613 RepID=A0A6B0UHT8_IXORI